MSEIPTVEVFTKTNIFLYNIDIPDGALAR